GYARWDITTGTLTTVTTPPSFGGPSPYPTIMSTPGSVTDLWMTYSSTMGRFSLDHSTDAGTTWTTVASNESLPSNLPANYPYGVLATTLGSDSRIHAYGFTIAAGRTGIVETNRGLGSSG